MLNSKDMQLTLQHITHQICKEGFCSRPQLLHAVWQATTATISNNWAQGRQTALSNLFLARGGKEMGKYYFYLEPTLPLLADCSIKYRADSMASQQLPAAINENSLFKNLKSGEKEYFKNDKELVLRFFYLIVGKIKDMLKAHRHIEILLENLGIIRLNDKAYSFEPFRFNEKGSLSSPNLQKYKRFSSNKKDSSTLRRENSSMAEDSKLTKLMEGSRVLYQSSSELKKTFNLKKRPYFHQVIVENEPPSVKICSDLLGAGIDPLTYDYSYSKLTDHPPQLLNADFKRQQHAVGRLPCVIDKFARTKGSQLTGTKVGNSIVVRIASNYSPTAKNYYLDIASKSIQMVAPQARIKLDNQRQRVIQPASEQQQYAFQTGMQSAQLETRVQLRREMYERYCQYYRQIVPNDCVAQLRQDSIERMIKQVKALVKKLGRKDGSVLINSLINEVNADYYLAYKRSVLNYILKDREEMVRVGISMSFEKSSEWGKVGQIRRLSGLSSLSLVQSSKMLEVNHILFPDCLNKIYLENEKLASLEIFKRRREGEYRPYNILYYIKRNTNQLNEAYLFLCEGWAKKIATLIEEQISLKQENYQKLRQFFNSIHIIMSNKLKELIYTTLNNITSEFTQPNPSAESANLLMINITEQAETITFIDDIDKVFNHELCDIIDQIIELTRKVPRVQNYLKLTTQLFIWGIDPKDTLLIQAKAHLREIVHRNYLKIMALREQLSKLQAVFRLKDGIMQWCKQPFKIEELKAKLAEIDAYQGKIFEVSCYYKVDMVVVDCIELKRKLTLFLKSLRRMLFESVEERLKHHNSLVLGKINNNIQLVSKSVSSTTQFVTLAKDIQHITHKEMALIRNDIDSRYREVMSLFTVEGFTGNLELTKSTYMCRQSYGELQYQLMRNSRRLVEERSELEKKLRDKTSKFQNQTLAWLKEVNSKIETFDMRKLYSEYLTVLGEYQAKVDCNRQTQKALNSEEEDLKWATTTFTSAIELQNVVQPNYQLWQLVAEYDSCIKEWKYIELSHFDIENNEAKVMSIDNRITRLITKLKNFAGLKIVYDLQNDVKEFLVQQVPIIKIFSNPGLKDRHWSLFNKRLPLAGYDLKELSYGRIKLLYEYQKNLKVLMSISNQAAKEFEIENEKQDMFEYWSKLLFALYHASDENIIFISQPFLDQQIEAIEHHLTKTLILKNSPFSKALVQMLTDWETWLINGRKILTAFRTSQSKFMTVRSIFKMEEINKILPIESTEYDSIENIWKSVIKKILEQPKVTEFFKSQKMPEIIEEIGKKADFIRNSFNTYLNLKRLQFKRLYFLPEDTILKLIQLIASDRLQEAYSLILHHCFNGVRSIERDDSTTFRLKSSVDALEVTCETMYSKKGKGKFFEELVALQKNMRENIRKEIKEITNMSGSLINLLGNYTLTAIFTHLELYFSTQQIKEGSINKSLHAQLTSIEKALINKVKETPSLKYENVLSKILFLKLRHQEIMKAQNSSRELFGFEEEDSGIYLKVCNSSIKFQFEYVGDEIPVFMPINTDRLIWHLAFSINNKVGTVCQNSTMLKQIALLTGQHYVEMNNPLHSIQNNFESCIMGIVSTNYWVHFDDRFVQVSASMLSVLTHTLQEKKEKLQSKQQTLVFKNNQLSLNPHSCLLLSFDHDRLKQIPTGILTCLRSVRLYKPQLSQIKKYLSACSLLEKIKNYLFTLQTECSQLQSNLILQQVQGQTSQKFIIKTVQKRIWMHLTHPQRLQFQEMFVQKPQSQQSIECKSWQQFTHLKQEQLQTALSKYCVVLAVGKQTCKSTIISKLMSSQQSKQLFTEERGINLNFIEEGVSDLSYLKYLQKARQKVIKEKQIIIYIDCELTPPHLAAISVFEHIHNLSLQHSKPLKVIVQTSSLEHLDPKSLTSYGLVVFNQSALQSIPSYQWWVKQLRLSSEDSVSVCELQNNFQSLLLFVLRMQKRSFNDGRLTLTKRFFGYFRIFLNHLNSKEVERMSQFDRESYIFNSFIYCAYWALGSNLRAMQAEHLKKHIMELHGEKLDIPGELNETYLNEENEWVYWDTLREEFVSEKENVPLYQIWVPTASNTKMLTMLIKLIENGHSIILCGNQSGRSSIFSEISSFELTYSSFLVDCHTKTSSNHLTSLTRGRIVYGEFKKNLILVDDLHLPQNEVCDILRTFIQRGFCANTSQQGKLNEDIFKPLVMASWDKQEHSPSFWRFYDRTIPLQLQRLTQNQLSSIFRAYFNAILLSNQADNSLLKLQNIIVNYCMHTVKVFPSISLTSIRTLVQSICRCNFSREESSILHHLLAESQSILQPKLPPHELTHFFRHMSYYYNKLLSIQLKNHNQLKEVAHSYIYEVRPQPQPQPQQKQTYQQLTRWINECIKDKATDILLSSFHIRLIQKMLWCLKANHSHVILLSKVKSGCHTVAKISGWLLKIGVMELKQMGVDGLLEEVVKILKTGGKVDECLSIVTSDLLTARPQLVKLVNSLIFSPEFHECFGQILMEQIIKSFNAQKKFLKKNVKKSELIKKIREKFNTIFHFCLTLNHHAYAALTKDFPKFAYLRVIEVEQYPAQALQVVSRKFIRQQSEEVLRIFLKIEDELKSNQQITGGHCISKGVLPALRAYERVMQFMEQRAKFQEENTEVWSKRIRMSQDKLDNLQKEKKLYETQHSQYFQEVASFAEQIQHAQEEAERVKVAYASRQQECEKVKAECVSMKSEYEKAQSQVKSQYNSYVQSLRQQLQSQDYLSNPKIQTMALAYELSYLNPCQMLIELSKDNFSKLLQLDFSELGTITTIIEKFKPSFQLLTQQESSLSIKLKEEQDIELSVEQLAYKCKELQDKEAVLRQEEADLKENQQTTIKAYEEIKDKIAQIQSINSILLKFEHILKSQNELSISLPNNLNGCAILVAYSLLYSLSLTPLQIQTLITTINNKLQEHRLQTSIKELLSFYPFQLQFRMLYQHQSSMQQAINLCALQSSDISCIAIGTPEDVVEWLSMVQSSNFVWMKPNEQIKDLLQRDQIVLIPNAEAVLIQKISSLLSKPFTTRNNTRVLLVEEEEITIHQNSKFIFIFHSHQPIPHQLLIHNLFVLRVSPNPGQAILRLLEKKLTNQRRIGSRCEMVNAYLKGWREIGMMDDKLHSIIMKMKKENVVSEIIYKKIEEEGENKLQNESRLQKYKQEIILIRNSLQQYNPLVDSLAHIYATHSLSLHQFTFMLSRILDSLEPEVMHGLASEMKAYLQVLLGREWGQFQDMTRFASLSSSLISKGLVILLTEDISLMRRYLRSTLLQSKSLVEICPQEVSLNSIKQGTTYVCQISRSEQWKQPLLFIQSNREKLANLNLIFIQLHSLTIPDDLATVLPSVPFPNIGQLVMQQTKKGFTVPKLTPSLQMQGATAYQEQLQNRAYLSSLASQTDGGSVLRHFLENIKE